MFKKLNGSRPVLCNLSPFLLAVIVLALVKVSGVSANVYANTHVIKIEPLKELKADTVKIYDVVDQMPEIEGDLKSIYENIKYPPLAVSRVIEGRVFVKFIVDTNGNVKDPVIIRDIGGGCGQAAIDAIKKSKFKPGQHKGEIVNVYFTLPIDFKLK